MSVPRRAMPSVQPVCARPGAPAAHSQSGFSSTQVLSEVQGHVAIATLNRPRALNALNTSMVESMYELYSQWEADPGVACILLKASMLLQLNRSSWSHSAYGCLMLCSSHGRNMASCAALAQELHAIVV